MTFRAFEVAVVPFPFTDRNTSKRRPALILSDNTRFNTPSGHCLMAMITSAKNSPWPLDAPIADLKSSGLPAPSKVRMKLFTLDQRLILKTIGTLSPNDQNAVMASLKSLLVKI